MFQLFQLGLLASLQHLTSGQILDVPECDAFKTVFGTGQANPNRDYDRGEGFVNGQSTDSGTVTRHELSCCSDEPATDFRACRGAQGVWANRNGLPFLAAKVTLGYGQIGEDFVGSGDPNANGGAMLWEGRNGCVHNVDWHLAKKICEAIVVNSATDARARLCTATELDTGRCGFGTGCWHNHDYVWSDTRASNQTTDCYKGRLPCCNGSPSSFLTRYDVCDGYAPGRADFGYCNQDMHQNDGNIQGCTNGRVGQEAGCQDPNNGLYACEVCPGCATHTGSCPGPKQSQMCTTSCGQPNNVE